MLVTAQCGSFAVKQHPDDERERGEEVEQPVREDRADQRRPDRPAARGIRRASTATRASSPTRPGSTTFANRPTQNAEKTVR